MNEGTQGTNGWGRPGGQQPAGHSIEPDWAALADQQEREHHRRKQRRVIAAAVGATLVVGGITATAVSLAGPGKDGRNGKGGDASRVAVDGVPTASPNASASAGPSPSGSAGAPASANPSGQQPAGSPNPSAKGATASGTAAPGPLDPLTVISSASTDTAPLTPETLFPAATLSADGKSWHRVTSAETSPCWKASTGGLGDVWAAQSCRTVLRATYASGSSAVTVGVAVFDSRTQADAVEHAHKGQIQGLVATGSIAFCTSTGCTNTHTAVGRYAFYTVSGTLKPGGTAADSTATAAGPDFGSYTRGRLLARGNSR
ncbi:hypothetical protein [Kitasatospora sp. GP82]|uniref:hypothetical protein n=1 Tax=Kitasatospora sp. GP82 TaxID=3035089 RepID=UPI0024751723|nr:hypothetical protein [Kitasatospora sp. GP82]MDH6125624.1 hypothetical protein [Kitasatospora sp. GP82]